MHLLLVDDEPLALARLVRLLGENESHTLHQASSAKEALEILENRPIDVLITDIRMNGLSGIALAYEVRSRNPKLPIIFQTAYPDHALEAFDIGAVDYLLKPFDKAQLERSLERAAPEELRILSKNRDTFYLNKPNEIYYVQADLSEVILRTSQGFSYYAKKISNMEELLNPYGFVRVHRSYLVNLELIEKFHSCDQSRLRFYFKNIEEYVESSKEGAKLFRQRFKG
jgi:two-component system LytT family response regulator